jgi:signal transduction histidine kinase/CHASE1-domain containing sensor protein
MVDPGARADLSRISRSTLSSGRMLSIGLSRNAWPAWVMLGVGLLASAFASLQVKQDIENDAVRQFAYACDQVTLKVQERLGAYALILRGGGGLFGASVSVERDEWRAYVEALQTAKGVPGVQGIGFAQAIPPDQLNTHIARIRAEGFPEYTVRPPGERALYTSIIYLEPFRDRNLRAFGFDMFSEPVRRAAMEQARDSGEAALSGKVELVQETGKEVQAGTLMYVPVYRNGAAANTVDQKRAALIGWAYSPYRMNDLMAGILANWTSQQGKEVDLHIYDGTRAIPQALLFDSKTLVTPAPHTLFYQTRTINFYGRQWLLEFDQPVTVSSISHVPAWWVLIGGFALSGLLAGLMLSVINTRAEAARIAAELTADLQDHSEQLSAIFDLSPDGFITFDAAHRIKYVSPAVGIMTGLKGDDIIGLDEDGFSKDLANLCAPAARFPGVARLREQQDAVAAGIATVGPTTGRPPDIYGARPAGADGRRQTIELTGCGNRVIEVNLRISRTENTSQILYFRDITLETEVDRLKSEFLSHAAHELRTPMASIFGFTELLITQEFEEAERRELLDTIFTQSELMISIINELLDLARIEARRGKDFTIEHVEVGELLHGIVAGFKPPQGRLSPQEPLIEDPLWVTADRKKLIQAVSNVISNAYKYSPGGGTVGIELVSPTSDVPLFGIRIADHGIGMTQEQLAHVCERFYRADASGKIPGTGLGMCIVKEIVELHGGRLELASKVGAGTTVTLWLPAAATQTDSPQSDRLHPASAHQVTPS